MNIRNIKIVLGLVIALLLVAACGPTPPIVGYGQIVAKRNLNYDQFKQPTSEKYTNYFYVGSNFSSIQSDNLKVDLTAAVVSDAQVGIYTTGFDENQVPIVQYLPKGVYDKIPDEFVRVVGAAIVDGQHMGVYCNYTEGQESFLILPPGEHPYPDYMVTHWPVGDRMYRTVSDGAFNAYKGGDTGPTGPGGGADLVETKIDKADLKDTDLDLTYTVDVVFAYDIIQKNAKVLCDLGSPEKAIQQMVATPMRGKGRTITGQFGIDVDTPQNIELLQAALRDMLIAENVGLPGNFKHVSLRSLEIGTAEYQAAIQQNATDLATAQARGLLLAQLQRNAEDENTLKETIAEGWATQMEALGCTDSWQCLWVVLNATENTPYFNGNDLQQPPQVP